MALIGNPGGCRLGSVGPRESWVVSQRSVENCDTCIRCQTQERMAFKSARQLPGGTVGVAAGPIYQPMSLLAGLTVITRCISVWTLQGRSGGRQPVALPQALETGHIPRGKKVSVTAELKEKKKAQFRD